MGNSRVITQKIKNRTTIWSSNYTPGYLSEENKNSNAKRYMHLYVHRSIIYNSQGMEALKCPSIGEQIKKSVHIQWITTQLQKKNEGLPFMATWEA